VSTGNGRPTELVTVTIDDRSVKVPKGTGLVETAASAGIEIPVFCYEPRLGPAVGACRMCLVEIDVGYDFNSLLKLNTAMGSAGVVALDDRCCMVQLGIRISEFYEHESCGKCTPCREGTRWMTQILRRLESGDALQSELDLLLDVCDRINGKCLCPLGETAAIAVASYVEKFRAEFIAHVEQGGCPFGDSSPLHDVLAPVAMHLHSPSSAVPA